MQGGEVWQIYVTWDKLEFAPQAAGTVSSSFTSCLLGFKVNSDSGPLTVPCAPLPTAATGYRQGAKADESSISMLFLKTNITTKLNLFKQERTKFYFP